MPVLEPPGLETPLAAGSPHRTGNGCAPGRAVTGAGSWCPKKLLEGLTLETPGRPCGWQEAPFKDNEANNHRHWAWGHSGPWAGQAGSEFLGVSSPPSQSPLLHPQMGQSWAHPQDGGGEEVTPDSVHTLELAQLLSVTSECVAIRVWKVWPLSAWRSPAKPAIPHMAAALRSAGHNLWKKAYSHQPQHPSLPRPVGHIFPQRSILSVLRIGTIIHKWVQDSNFMQRYLSPKTLYSSCD